MSTLAINTSNTSQFVAGWLRNRLSRYQQNRIYRQTLNELARLSDRELADIGLHRSMLERVAYQAADRSI